MGKGHGSQGGDIQSCSSDGLGVCGRIAGVGGIFVLAFYLIAVKSSSWATTESLGMGQGLEVVGEATFGLSKYCLKSNVAVFGGDHYTCHSYDDILAIKTADGTWFNETGCNRFDGICEANELVRAALVFSILFLFVGCVFSEKVEINGLMCSLAAIGGFFAMCAWLDFQTNLESADSLEGGAGLGLICGGWVIAMISGIGACVDCGYINKDEKLDLCNDGINIQGRIGSALTVLTWMFFLIGVMENDWSSTGNLGVAGELCNDDYAVGGVTVAPCDGNAASFSLRGYCVEASVGLYGDMKEDVCLDYGEDVTIAGSNVTMDGWERFESFGLQHRATGTMIGGIVAVIAAGLADLFSEKLLICTVLCSLSALSGICAMGAWLTFQTELDGALSEASTTGAGLFWVMGGWMVALLGAILYCCDYRTHKKNSSGGGGGGGGGKNNSDDEGSAI